MAAHHCSSDSFTDTTSGEKRKRVPEEGGREEEVRWWSGWKEGRE